MKVKELKELLATYNEEAVVYLYVEHKPNNMIVILENGLAADGSGTKIEQLNLVDGSTKKPFNRVFITLKPNESWI
jgi:hypothetical protein